MEKKGISQEGLKLIACLTMLIDHIGAVLLPGLGLRIIGRIAFPVYCFLMVEGAAHSHNQKKYGQRLLIGALLAEFPFDLLFFGQFTWTHQSVMVTLLIGYFMILWARKQGILLPLLVCFFAAELLCTDYGGFGIALIAVFWTTSGKSYEPLLRIFGMALVFWCMESYRVTILGLQISIQMFGLLAMIPIAFYSGEKRTYSKWVQWGFYLFYPVHMLVLLLIERSGL